MATITLGKTDYTLDRLPLRAASAMRKRIKDELDQVFELAGSLSGLEASDPNAVADALRKAAATIVDLPERLFELICEFSPAVAVDKETLLDSAYDEQVFTAFVEVLKSLFPLAEILPMLNGLLDQATSKSSPGQNGK